MNIFKAMKPDEVYQGVSLIPLDKMKKMGKKCFFLDFDNTLGPDRATAPDDYSFACVKKIQEAGFTCCLVSNAKSERSAGIAEILNVPCVTYAKKPRTDGIKRAFKLMNVTPDEVVMVGDQVFTDVMAGRLAGCYTIMVEKYLPKEVWYVKIKRPFEAIVRFFGKF